MTNNAWQLTGDHGKRPDGYEEVIIYSKTNRVSCMGEHMDHPKVYYTLRVGETKSCEYCGRKWKRISFT